MTVVVFSGPSLRPTDRVGPEGVVWRPPVAQGDVLAAAVLRPSLIAIIDGYFEGVPAVLHKEILWALDKGTTVAGAASMGALRAAELHAFGMVGVGRIFELYRDGTLFDDADVAVLHGPAEAGWPVLTEAMVNVRATLDAAVAAGTLEQAAANAVAGAAERIFYKERGWSRILEASAAQGVPAEAVAALQAFLPEGRVDLKRDDARRLLASLGSLPAPEPAEPRPPFEWTEIFDRTYRRVMGGDAAGSGAGAAREVLDELRLDPERYRTVAERALLRRVLVEAAEREGRQAGPAALQAARQALTERHGLWRARERAAWCAANGLEPGGLNVLLRREALVTEALAQRGAAVDAALLDELRLAGLYPGLAERAAAKREALAEQGLDDLEPTDIGAGTVATLLWYFEQRLNRPVPDDLEAWARAHGFNAGDDFRRAILREHVYVRRIGGKPPG